MPRPLLRRAVIALFVLAAAAFTVVVVDRWGPCVEQGIGSAECFQRHDDSFEAGMALTGPHALNLVAIVGAYLMLGLAIGLAGHVSTTWLPRVCGWLAALPALLTAAGFVDGALQDAGWWGWMMVLAPLATPVLAAFSVLHHRAGPLTGFYAVAVAATTLLVDFYLTLMTVPLFAGGFFSHDTTPGTWLPTTLGSLLAAGAFTQATRPRTGAGPAASPDRMGAWTSSSGR